MQELGLDGWARNCDDGCVEIMATGDDDALTALKNWCTRGPIQAKVERIEEENNDSL